MVVAGPLFWCVNNFLNLITFFIPCNNFNMRFLILLTLFSLRPQYGFSKDLSLFSGRILASDFNSGFVKVRV